MDFDCLLSRTSDKKTADWNGHATFKCHQLHRRGLVALQSRSPSTLLAKMITY